MPDIFLSYASTDLLRVQPLIRALQEHGWSVWWDRTIPPGQTFDQVIQAALDASRCVIVVWSQAAVVSDWVREEATEGRERRILIPVMLDEVRLPLGFRQIQAARLFHWQGDRLDAEFVRIVQAVTLLIGEPRREGTTHRPTQFPRTQRLVRRHSRSRCRVQRLLKNRGWKQTRGMIREGVRRSLCLCRKNLAPAGGCGWRPWAWC